VGSFSKARKSPPPLVRMPLRWVLYSPIAAPRTAGLANELWVTTLTG